MAKQRYLNNYTVRLQRSVEPGDTVLYIDNEDYRLPLLSGGDYYIATVWPTRGLGQVEIVKITAVTNGSVTVVRGFENTVPSAHMLGDELSLRATAGTLAGMVSFDELSDATNPALGATLVGYNGTNVKEVLDDNVAGIEDNRTSIAATTGRVETLEGDVSELQEKALNGTFISYQTYSAMVSDTGQPNGTTGRVTNDSNAANNGYYTWYSSGSSWVFSGLQPVSYSDFNAGMQAQADADRLQPNQPNLLSYQQTLFSVLPRILNGTAVKSEVAGVIGLRMDNEVNGTARVTWQLPAALFTTELISAQVTILQATSGTGGTIRIYQRDENGDVVAQTNLADGLIAAINNPTTYSQGGITLDADAVTIELDVALANTGGNRTIYLYAPFVANGSNAVYRSSEYPLPPLVNYFPNPLLTADGATTYQGVAKTFDGFPGVEMTGSGASRQVVFDLPVRVGFQEGDSVTLSAEAFSDVSGNNSSTDISLYFIDDDGATIGTILVTGLTAANAWQTLSQTRVIPANTAAIRCRFTKRSAAAVGRLRKATLTTSSQAANIIDVFDGAGTDVVPPKLSFFPNPRLTADGASLYQATPMMFDGEYGAEMTGSGTTQIFYDLPVSLGFQPGDRITLQAQLYSNGAGNNTSMDMSIIPRDGAGNQIGSILVSGVSEADNWQSLSQSVTLPAGTESVRLRFVKRNAVTLGRVRRVALLTENASANIVQTASSGDTPTGSGVKTIYMNAGGNDANDGTISAPVRTPARAMQLHNPGDTILINDDSDYYDVAGFSVAGHGAVTIAAMRDKRVRLILGTQLQGISKTAGFTKVYQASLATSPDLWVWHHDVEDPTTTILPAERMALQRGRTCRLTSTRIEPVGSIADIDSAAGPSWYWNSGVLYFSITGGGDATGAHIRVPRGGASNSGVFGGTGAEDVELRGIHVLYAFRDGIDGGNCASFRAYDCSGNFGGFNGISYDDTLYTELVQCETAGNRGDGDNGHRLETDTYHTNCIAQCVDNWSHDNYDDGSSYHEDFRGTYRGGLYEYNGDRGIANSYGAHTSGYGVTARYNGQYDMSGGEGFCVIGTMNPSDDPGYGTQFDLFNCVSYGNRDNYAATNEHSMVLTQCISMDPIDNHFLTSSNSIITLRNCTYSGAGTLKGGTGTYIVENSELVE